MHLILHLMLFEVGYIHLTYQYIVNEKTFLLAFAESPQV